MLINILVYDHYAPNSIRPKPNMPQILIAGSEHPADQPSIKWKVKCICSLNKFIPFSHTSHTFWQWLLNLQLENKIARQFGPIRSLHCHALFLIKYCKSTLCITMRIHSNEIGQKQTVGQDQSEAIIVVDTEC